MKAAFEWPVLLLCVIRHLQWADGAAASRCSCPDIKACCLQAETSLKTCFIAPETWYKLTMATQEQFQWQVIIYCFTKQQYECNCKHMSGMCSVFLWTLLCLLNISYESFGLLKHCAVSHDCTLTATGQVHPPLLSLIDSSGTLLHCEESGLRTA